MKNFFLKDKYRLAMIVGIVIMLSPLLFMLLLNIPGILYPNDCGFGFQHCEHTIVHLAGNLSFGVLIFGLPIMLLGGCVVVVSAVLYGVHALRNHHTAFRYVKITIGTIAASILIVALWIPSGPDECSRSLTYRQYNACLEKELAGKVETEARVWLETRGYKTSKSYPQQSWGSLGHEKFRTQPSITTYFEAHRAHGRPHSLPYGTNFARYVLPMFPAPATYTIGIGVYTNPKNTYEIHTDWSFSFL